MAAVSTVLVTAMLGCQINMDDLIYLLLKVTDSRHLWCHLVVIQALTLVWLVHIPHAWISCFLSIAFLVGTKLGNRPP